MRNCCRKKGYFFLLDGLIALSILVSGIIIIGSVFVSKPIFKPPYNVGDDILLMLSSTNVSSIDMNKHPGIKKLFNDGMITNNESTLMQQAGKFFYDFCSKGDTSALDYINTTIFEIVNNVIPYPYYAELNISDSNGGCIISHQRVYTNFIPVNDAIIKTSKDDSQLLIVTQKTIFGNYNQTTIFGPYIAKFSIWR